MGCLALLALLVLHRAKLLASNQSILALGVAPMQVVSCWCRCIVQRLCVADFKRPCLKLWVFNFGHPCPSLVKGEVLSPEKIRATTGGIVTPTLASHQLFQNPTIPLAFRRGVGLPLPKHHCNYQKQFNRIIM